MAIPTQIGGYERQPSGWFIKLADGTGPYSTADGVTFTLVSSGGGAQSLTAAEFAALPLATRQSMAGMVIYSSASPYSVLGVVDGAGNLPSSYVGVTLLDPTRVGAGRGTLICDWSVSPTGTASTTDVYPEPIYPLPAVPQANGQGADYYATANSTGQSSNFHSIGIWLKADARADGEPYTYARLDFGVTNTFTDRCLSALTIKADGIWRFYVAHAKQWGTSGTFTLGTTTFDFVRIVEAGAATSLTLTGALAAGATSATLNANFAGTSGIYPVRFSNNNVRRVTLVNGSTAATWGTPLTATATTAIVYSTTRLAQQTGDKLQAGPVYRNPAAKSFAFVRFDDGLADQYTARQSLTTSYVGQSGVTVPIGSYSAKDLVNLFGLKANCFICTNRIGQTSNFMTVAQLVDLQNTYGWNICVQTANNPLSSNNFGIRLLGPLGYDYKTNVYGSIASIAGNVVTTTNVHRITTTGTFAGEQGFPVQILGPTPPATTLSIGQKVWLRDVTTTTFTIHQIGRASCRERVSSPV